MGHRSSTLKASALICPELASILSAFILLSIFLFYMLVTCQAHVHRVSNCPSSTGGTH